MVGIVAKVCIQYTVVLVQWFRIFHKKVPTSGKDVPIDPWDASKSLIKSFADDSYNVEVNYFKLYNLWMKQFKIQDSINRSSFSFTLTLSPLSGCHPLLFSLYLRHCFCSESADVEGFRVKNYQFYFTSKCLNKTWTKCQFQDLWLVNCHHSRPHT